METNGREVESYRCCLINREQNQCSSYWINVVCSHSTLLPFRRESASFLFRLLEAPVLSGLWPVVHPYSHSPASPWPCVCGHGSLVLSQGPLWWPWAHLGDTGWVLTSRSVTSSHLWGPFVLNSSWHREASKALADFWALPFTPPWSYPVSPEDRTLAETPGEQGASQPL